MRNWKTRKRKETVAMWQRICILTVIIYNSGVRSKQFEECASVETSGIYVASYNSCSIYIYCDGDNSFDAKCFDDNYYDPKLERCVEHESFECKIPGVENITIENLNKNEELIQSTQSTKITTITTTTSGNSVILSKKPEVIDKQQTPQQEQKQNPVSSNNWNNINILVPPVLPTPATMLQTFTCPPATAIESGSERFNGSAPQSQFPIPNPDSCSSYFICYQGISIAMYCARGMHFNRKSGRCERAETVSCYKPTQLTQTRSKCSEGIYDFMPHPSKCEYFYYCSNGWIMIHRCPLYYTWHYERRTCVHLSASKCFNNNLYAI